MRSASRLDTKRSRYTVKQYGYRFADIDNDITRVDIKLERVAGQEPINLKVPTPSQRDDYKLYDGLIGADYREKKGDLEYTKWREFEDKEAKEKERWLWARSGRTDAIEGPDASEIFKD